MFHLVQNFLCKQIRFFFKAVIIRERVLQDNNDPFKMSVSFYPDLKNQILEFGSMNGKLGFIDTASN